MNFKRIRTKMLVTLLPVIILAMGALTVLASLSCSKIVNEQISDTMEATLEAESETIENYLEGVQTMATVLAHTVETTCRTLDMPHYGKALSAVIKDNDMVLGSGIWFEPYAYKETEQYMGPYFYKNDGVITVTYDYSNAAYDYFSQEYYTRAKEATGAVITDPYYDATSNTIMSSCSVPMFENGIFIGCVTVDMELSSIEKVISEIQIGDNGTAFLLSNDGVYLAGVENEKITQNQLITSESNASLAEAGRMITAADAHGETSYTAEDGSAYKLYYGAIPATGWHVVIQMPESELMKPIQQLLAKLVTVSVVALAVCCFLLLLQISVIAKNIRRVQVFAQHLAQGNFTIEELQVKSKDELGVMSHALNEMYMGNRSVISNISEHSAEITSASDSLKDSSGILMEEFTDIQGYMAQISEAMMAASAATQEVNASAEEVNSSVDVLTAETEESKKTAQEIQKRAVSMQEASQKSYISATQLTVQFEQKLDNSMEHAKVVANIGELTNVIAGIAEEINLLSLNASIEAARAGEQGKGFAVVAGEIGKLAGDTAHTVENIQQVIGEVQNAFQQLADNSKSLLTFIQETVTPDYQLFVDTAMQYGKDAEFFAEISARVSQMSESVQTVMSEVTQAIQNIAESAQETAEIGGKVTSSVAHVSQTAEQVRVLSLKQQEIADDLDAVVKRFQL